MKIGDLVKYKYNDWGRPRAGLVTSVDGHTVWWIDTSGYKSWTYRINLEVINESR